MGDDYSKPLVSTPFDAMAHEAVSKKLAFIALNREKLIEAFVAQHGFNPDEATLVTQDTYVDGMARTYCWVERRKDTPVAASSAEVPGVLVERAAFERGVNAAIVLLESAITTNKGTTNKGAVGALRLIRKLVESDT